MKTYTRKISFIESTQLLTFCVRGNISGAEKAVLAKLKKKFDDLFADEIENLEERKEAESAKVNPQNLDWLDSDKLKKEYVFKHTEISAVANGFLEFLNDPSSKWGDATTIYASADKNTLMLEKWLDTHLKVNDIKLIEMEEDEDLGPADNEKE